MSRSRVVSELEARHLRVCLMQTSSQYIRRTGELSTSESPRKRRRRERSTRTRNDQSHQRELGSSPSRHSLKKLLKKTRTMVTTQEQTGILIVQGQQVRETRELAAVRCWEVTMDRASTCLGGAAQSIGSIRVTKHMRLSERLRRHG